MPGRESADCGASTWRALLHELGKLGFLHESVHDGYQGALILVGQRIDFLPELAQIGIADVARLIPAARFAELFVERSEHGSCQLRLLAPKFDDVRPDAAARELSTNLAVCFADQPCEQNLIDPDTYRTPDSVS